MAGELAEAGLEMALDAKDQALTPDAPVEPAMFEGLSRTFAKLSRSTRLSLMLQDRLIKDLIAFDKGEVPDAGRDDRKDEITQIVRIIVDPRDDPETRERLEREIMERLERENLETAALSYPVGEHMTIILKDLYAEGSRLAGEAWAVDEAASGGMADGWRRRQVSTERSETPAHRASSGDVKAARHA